MRCILAQVKKRFLEWAGSEPRIDVSPDVDLFHEFKEVRVVILEDIYDDLPRSTSSRRYDSDHAIMLQMKAAR